MSAYAELELWAGTLEERNAELEAKVRELQALVAASETVKVSELRTRAAAYEATILAKNRELKHFRACVGELGRERPELWAWCQDVLRRGL